MEEQEAQSVLGGGQEQCSEEEELDREVQESLCGLRRTASVRSGGDTASYHSSHSRQVGPGQIGMKFHLQLRAAPFKSFLTNFNQPTFPPVYYPVNLQFSQTTPKLPTIPQIEQNDMRTFND